VKKEGKEELRKVLHNVSPARGEGKDQSSLGGGEKIMPREHFHQKEKNTKQHATKRKPRPTIRKGGIDKKGTVNSASKKEENWGSFDG